MVGIGNKDYKELLEKILAGQPVYVKDIGTKVLVTNYSKGRGYKDQDHLCSILFLEVPNKKAIDKVDYFQVVLEEQRNTLISKNTIGNQPNPYEINVSAKIHIKNLRAIPFKTGAGKLLYGNKK